MEIKKSKEADLERERTGFTLCGLLISLCLLFIAVEWAQSDLKKVTVDDVVAMDTGEEEMEAPQSEQNTPPPPPPPPAIEQPQIEMPTEFKKNENAADLDIKVSSEDKGEAIAAAPVVETVVEKEEEEEIDNTIYTHVEKKAEFPGGKKALMAYLSSNIKYPKAALESGTQGMVILKFTVNRDGTISDIEVQRSPDAALEKEAIRVVKNMPRWSPGENGNKKVRSKFSLPVSFRLAN